MGTKEEERRAVSQASFICEGEYWTVAFENRLIRLRDSKGLRQLALLLHEPGREFHVLDLGPRIDPEEIHSSAARIDPEDLAKLPVHSSLSGDGGDLLDAQAVAAYKQRRVELTEELQEAREFQDEERVARIEDEIDQIEGVLKGALGLSGRSRKAGSAAEQARVNITKNIGRALDQIEAKHDSLGRLLKSTIKTGIFCSYQPDPRFAVAWKFEAEQPADASSSTQPDQRRVGAPDLLDGPSPANQLERVGLPATPGRLVWGRFIGRTVEMTALRAAIDASLGGQASLVMLVGEPGIGKTRLAEEAGAYARQRGAQVLVGHSYEGEAASPYSPFVEAIHEYASTSPEEVLKSALGDGAPHVAKLVPEIRKHIPDLTPSPAADQNGVHLFDSVASLLVNASEANPIMLLLEDLHWADKASLQLLQHLARRLRGSCLMVVGTYRDIEVDRSHPLAKMLGELRRERLYERMLLHGLSESEVNELIEAISQQKVVEGFGESFVRAIVRETEGNPFFIEETLRHLVEIGSLYRSEGRWVTEAKSIAEIGVPEGVRDVIGRRLSRLSEATNRVLEAAAVLGREFEFEVLGRMNEPGVDSAWPAVEEGLSNRLLLESRGGGGPCYAFTHALVRQTLVEELSLPHRQQLHLKAAQAIEAVHERNLERRVSALANHYRMAGSAADTEKTIDYSIRAGSAAFAVFAHEEAGTHWRAALELMDEQGGGDRRRRANLLLLLGDGIVSTGPKSVEYLEAAARLVEELGDTQAAIDVHSRLALYLATSVVGAMDVQRATPHFEKAEALLAKQPESWRHASHYLNVAVACSAARRILDGIAAAKHAMEICERQEPPIDLDGLWSVAAAVLAGYLVSSGSVTEGLRLVDKARRRADPIRDTSVGTAVALCGGTIYHFLGNPREAQKWCKRELAKPRTALARNDNAPLQLHELLVGTCINAGELSQARAYIAAGELTRSRAAIAEIEAGNKPADFLFFEGEWELAAKRETALFERLRAAGNVAEELGRASLLARAHRFTGKHALSVQVLHRALEISVGSGDIEIELIARSLLATMVADAGDATEAMRHLERCRQIVGAGENWFGRAGDVERAEAVVAVAQSKYQVAEAHFEKAIATFQHCCLPWEEADTLQYWGRALLAAGERARAIEKFDAAIEIYRSHGAGTRFIEYVMADKTAGLIES